MAPNEAHDSLVPKPLVLVVTLVVLCSHGMAQSSSGCTNVIISLSPCLNYITSNSSTPSSGCCTQLASVVKSQPRCLCQVLNGGGSSLGLNINQTQALELPNACNVETPSTSQCYAAAPGSSPTTPSGSNTVPSNAMSIRLTIIPVLFSVLVASYIA